MLRAEVIESPKIRILFSASAVLETTAEAELSVKAETALKA